MKTVDARGVSCPEPLLMLQKAIKSEKELTLLVDSKNAMENCEKLAVKKGYSVNVDMSDEDYYKLLIKKATK